MKCKCGHEGSMHTDNGHTNVGECYIYLDGNYKNKCDCKQFIPQERKMSKEEMDLLYNKGEGLDYSFEENKGCGKPLLEGVVFCCGDYSNGYIQLCPSCLSNSLKGASTPNRKINPEDKDPDDVSNLPVVVDSGSDFIWKLKEKMNLTFVELAKSYDYNKETKQWLALYKLTQKLGKDVAECFEMIQEDMKGLKGEEALKLIIKNRVGNL
ncbi:hypothetical protein LCGC14_2372720 [marine sediment metagenome]|uniref:Uncharacterized protein n=1 Tax=marine sediment metagenome TaxID=412755 RepID=A0A0F9EFN4_9ZZZZ